MSISHFTEENRIWLQMLQGQERALEFIFKKYYPVLYDYGIKISSQPELVRDTIQELFIYIWTHRQALSNVHSVRAYLLTAFRRSFIKKINSSQKIYSIENLNPVKLTGKAFSPEFFVIARETEQIQKKLLQNALSQIPERMREALYLKTYQGLSYQEISEVLGITYQVARNYIWEALKRIRSLILEGQESV